MGMQKDLKVSKASLYCFIDAHVVLRIFLPYYFLPPNIWQHWKNKLVHHHDKWDQWFSRGKPVLVKVIKRLSVLQKLGYSLTLTLMVKEVIF